jgi:hypothetical protein
MWIGIAVVMLVGGGLVSDTAMFDSKAECEAMNAQVVEQIKASDQAMSYHVECFAKDKFLKDK